MIAGRQALILLIIFIIIILPEHLLKVFLLLMRQCRGQFIFETVLLLIISVTLYIKRYSCPLMLAFGFILFPYFLAFWRFSSMIASMLSMIKCWALELLNTPSYVVPYWLNLSSIVIPRFWPAFVGRFLTLLFFIWILRFQLLIILSAIWLANQIVHVVFIAPIQDYRSK